MKDSNVARGTSDVWTAGQGVCLAGRRVLVVEDEVLVAATIVCEMQFAGAEVVGPAYTLDEALELLIETIDVAVLDINLNGAKVWPVARQLRDRGVPYVFASANAFGPGAVPDDFAAAPRFDKPVRMSAMLRTLAELTKQAA